MSNVYLSNAFSLSMLRGKEINIKIKEIDKDTAKRYLAEKEYISAVGHKGTAEFLRKILKIDISTERRQINLEKGDILIVFQLLQRLPEGKILSEKEINQIPYKFYMVQII